MNEQEPIETDNGLSAGDARLEQPPQEPGWVPGQVEALARTGLTDELTQERQRMLRRADLPFGEG